MKMLKSVTLFGLITLLLFTICPSFAVAQEGSMGKHEGSMAKEEGVKPGKTMMCNEEHMKMMMQSREDRICVVEEVLADEDSREILMEKVAADPKLRKKMMKKCEIVEKKTGEGSMMKHEEMMHQEGSAMKEEGEKKVEESMMKHGGGKSKK